MMGIIGRKIGMTQIQDPFGDMVPVTVLQAGPATVTKICTKTRDGYDAVQLGFEDIKEKHLRRPLKKFFEKNGLKPKRILREFRLDSDKELEQFKIGQELQVDLFREGDFVDVQGVTIGKGFQGGTRRWGMKGGPESHGSMYHRRPGSAGSTTFPGRTWKGHHNPGHMGHETQTQQNLLVLKVLKDDGALVVRGAVPGPRNGIVTIRKSFKKARIDLTKMKKVSAIREKKVAAKKAPAKKE